MSASLTGIMCRIVLMEEEVRVGQLEFLRVNLLILIYSIVVACTVLVGETCIVMDNSPHQS
jgi:hypothetical protein